MPLTPYFLSPTSLSCRPVLHIPPAPPHVQRAAVKEKAVLFAELAKLRLSSLVATSSLFGYAFGAPVAFDLPYVATATCVTVGTLLCSASANTINQVGCECITSILRIAVSHRLHPHLTRTRGRETGSLRGCAGPPPPTTGPVLVCVQWWEVRTDGLMHRTKARPLPSGRITPQGALCVAAGSGMAGTALLLAGTNPVVAALGLGNIVLYGCVASRVLAKCLFVSVRAYAWWC